VVETTARYLQRRGIDIAPSRITRARQNLTELRDRMATAWSIVKAKTISLMSSHQTFELPDAAATKTALTRIGLSDTVARQDTRDLQLLIANGFAPGAIATFLAPKGDSINLRRLRQNLADAATTLYRDITRARFTPIASKAFPPLPAATISARARPVPPPPPREPTTVGIFRDNGQMLVEVKFRQHKAANTRMTEDGYKWNAERRAYIKPIQEATRTKDLAALSVTRQAVSVMLLAADQKQAHAAKIANALRIDITNVAIRPHNGHVYVRVPEDPAAARHLATLEGRPIYTVAADDRATRVLGDYAFPAPTTQDGYNHLLDRLGSVDKLVPPPIKYDSPIILSKGPGFTAIADGAVTTITTANLPGTVDALRGLQPYALTETEILFRNDIFTGHEIAAAFHALDLYHMYLMIPPTHDHGGVDLAPEEIDRLLGLNEADVLFPQARAHVKEVTAALARHFDYDLAPADTGIAGQLHRHLTTLQRNTISQAHSIDEHITHD
jgi:hypothetical protein